MQNLTAIQLPLFHKVIKDPKLIEETPIYFFDNGSIQEIFKLIKKHKNIWNNPSSIQLKALVKTEGIENISDDILDNLISNNEILSIDTKWLEEQYQKRMKLSILNEKFRNIITDFKLLGDNPPLEAVEKFQKKIQTNILSINTSNEKKWESILDPILPDDAIPISTGFSILDEWQILRKKRTTCFIGKTNSGKTYSLINLAATLTRSGYKVAYLSFEVERQDIRIRILSQLFGTNSEKIKQLQNNNELKKLWNEKCSSYKLPEVFSDSYDTYDHSKLLQEILAKEEISGTKFDAILIDYMSLLDSSEEQMYLKGKDISQAFARYSKAYNWAIITAAQVNRGGLMKTRLTMDDISESAAMLHTFDFIVSIIHNERLRDSDTIAWELIKARYVNAEHRPGSITSFSINWRNGGSYTENYSDVNDEIINNINEDNDKPKKPKVTKNTKNTKPHLMKKVIDSQKNKYLVS